VESLQRSGGESVAIRKRYSPKIITVKVKSKAESSSEERKKKIKEKF
jgi:hypothetical protein